MDLSSTLNDPEIAQQFIAEMTEVNSVENLMSKFENPQLAEQFRTLHDALPKPSTDAQ
ncbi:MAG: hypothetical protein ABF391_05905 [Akkermansiaceae bacterium]